MVLFRLLHIIGCGMLPTHNLHRQLGYTFAPLLDISKINILLMIYKEVPVLLKDSSVAIRGGK